MPIYDNPTTRRREGWHEGEIVWWITKELILSKPSYPYLQKWGTYPPPPDPDATATQP